MIVGIAKEIHGDESRVSIVPAGVSSLISEGHEVIIEKDAGLASGITDEDYIDAGGEIVGSIDEVYKRAKMILKIKQPTPSEYDLLREEHIVLAYMQAQERPDLTKTFLEKKLVSFAYENVMDKDGAFPLLAPMSDLAGKVGVLIGTYHLFNTVGGNGILIGGAPGIEAAKVIILGTGNSGIGAAQYALGLGADVTILGRNVERLKNIKQSILPGIKTLHSNSYNIRKILPEADMVINSVKLDSDTYIISRDMLKLMKANSLIVDTDCQPDGAIETSVESSHGNPVYVVDGIRHITIANLPSGVTQTASYSLANSTISYVMEIANKGWLKASKENQGLKNGLGFAKGYLTFKTAAVLQDLPYTPVEKAIRLLDN